VVKGEPLFVIETDKANLDIEAPASGVLQRISAEPGSEVKVRSTIGVILAEGEEDEGEEAHPQPEPGAAPDGSEAQALQAPMEAATARSASGPRGEPLPPERLQRVFASPRARRLAEQEGVPLASLKPSGPQQMIVERDVRAYVAQRPAAPKVTPVARRLAEEAGLDLATLTPSEPGGRVTRADVEAALAASRGAQPAGMRWIEPSPTRRTIALRMAESQQAAAQVTLTRELDATELVQLREKVLAELSADDPRPTYTDFLVCTVALMLREHPYLNATTDGERIGLSDEVHVAVAVDTERGLVAPVVRHADRKGLLKVARERAELTRRALDGSVTPDELTGGTFTITNLGPLGVDAFTPIINPPQAAILGVGRIHAGPAVHRGELCVRQLMTLSLTFDHRVVDGAPAARFLRDVVRLIEKPHLIWL
jgi:pyruvate dehydrogenase E2 component (dihydrolipoamide acetyltransferase)